MCKMKIVVFASIKPSEFSLTAELFFQSDVYIIVNCDRIWQWNSSQPWFYSTLSYITILEPITNNYSWSKLALN